MSQIIDSVEDGKYVFRKKRESPEEELFFNKKYFEMIGYPDVEVSIEIESTEHSMKGGYYKNTQKLTVPFRQFVFLLQGNKNMNNFSFFSNKNTTTPKNTTDQKTDLEQKGYFDRLFQYNNDAINAIKTYLKPKENANEKEETSNQTTVASKLWVSNKEAKPTDSPKPVEEPKPTDSPNPLEDVKPVEELKPVEEAKPTVVEYWVVKIPIRKSSDAEPKGKYEKMEQQLTQFLLQEKVNKSLMLVMEYELKEVGEDAIYFYKGKEDNRMQIMELFKSGLKGSKISKSYLCQSV